MHRGRLKGWMLPLSVLLASGIMGAVRDAHYGGDITWARDYAAAVKQARQKRCPLLISFSAPGCGWCAKLDAETFTDSRVVALSHEFVCARLESDVESDVCARYHVLDYPTILIADTQGRPLARVPGYVPPDQLTPVLRASLRAEARSSTSTGG